MFSVGRNEDCVARCDLLLSVLVSNLAAPLKDVDLMLPVVAVEWSEAASVHREVAHQKGWCSVLLVDEPLYPHGFSAFLSHRSIGCLFQIGLVQPSSPYKKRPRQDKASGAWAFE